MSKKDDFVPLGKVTAPHGIKGQLRITVYSGETDAITSVKSVMLQGGNGAVETFEVARAVLHGKKVLLSLKGFDNINQVLHLVGRELIVTRGQLPEPEEGEFFWCDLIGLSVVTDAGESLGTLTEIISTGSNDVYVVTSGEREYLIPALEDVVVKVDLEAGKMTVSPPEGLFDL